MWFTFFLLIIALFIVLIIASPNASYLADKSASGGLKPNGGMRNATIDDTELADRNVTYNSYDMNIYDYHVIPQKYTWGIGHWSKM
jgi:hypothetical protein